MLNFSSIVFPKPSPQYDSNTFKYDKSKELIYVSVRDTKKRLLDQLSFCCIPKVNTNLIGDGKFN